MGDDIIRTEDGKINNPPVIKTKEDMQKEAIQMFQAVLGAFLSDTDNSAMRVIFGGVGANTLQIDKYGLTIHGRCLGWHEATSLSLINTKIDKSIGDGPSLGELEKLIDY